MGLRFCSKFFHCGSSGYLLIKCPKVYCDSLTTSKYKFFLLKLVIYYCCHPSSEHSSEFCPQIHCVLCTLNCSASLLYFFWLKILVVYLTSITSLKHLLSNLLFSDLCLLGASPTSKMFLSSLLVLLSNGTWE